MHLPVTTKVEIGIPWDFGVSALVLLVSQLPLDPVYVCQYKPHANAPPHRCVRYEFRPKLLLQRNDDSSVLGVGPLSHHIGGLVGKTLIPHMSVSLALVSGFMTSRTLCNP